MGIQSGIRTISKIPKDFLETLKSAHKEVDEIKNYKDAKAMLIYGGRARVTDARMTNNTNWVDLPKYNLRFKNKHSVILEPDNIPFFFCHHKNPATLYFENPPVMDVCDRDIIEIHENQDGKQIKVYDIEEYELKGGEILTEVGYDLGTTSLLKYIQPPSKREILYIALISGLFFFIMGILFALIFIA